MPEIRGSEKRQGLHLACFRNAAVESKENSLARTPKMAVNCESQANRDSKATLGEALKRHPGLLPKPLDIRSRATHSKEPIA